ncbi:MAG: hypothetical protein JWN04_263 [Myxococcaceae bacterium]|nr:hypothetical protein [Myxococcaceae bacterium]
MPVSAHVWLSALAFELPVYSHTELSGPWGGQGGCGNPGAYVLSLGGAELLVGERTLQLGEGDVALLLTGAPHIVRADARAHPLPAAEIALRAAPTERGYRYAPPGSHPTDANATLTAITFGTQGASSGLRRALPDVIRLRPRELERPARSALDALHAECARGRAANVEILLRLGEIAALHALERYGPEATSWDAAVMSAAARALETLEAPWNVLRLARYAGLSRSRFCERFQLCYGEPPMRWLRRHRLERSARALGIGHCSVAELAERFGYKSESAFRKAFSRELGRTARLPSGPSRVD